MRWLDKIQAGKIGAEKNSEWSPLSVCCGQVAGLAPVFPVREWGQPDPDIRIHQPTNITNTSTPTSLYQPQHQPTSPTPQHQPASTNLNTNQLQHQPASTKHNIKKPQHQLTYHYKMNKLQPNSHEQDLDINHPQPSAQHQLACLNLNKPQHNLSNGPSNVGKSLEFLDSLMEVMLLFFSEPETAKIGPEKFRSSFITHLEWEGKSRDWNKICLKIRLNSILIFILKSGAF